jgi:carboxymethylenebutenolidase
MSEYPDPRSRPELSKWSVRAVVCSAPGTDSKTDPKERSLTPREENLSAANVMLIGHNGDAINAYQATPGGGVSFPGVVIIHHMPGWDSGTKEITRTFAAHGYNAICPNLYYREGPDADPDDAAATARANGGVPDDRLVGDVRGAIEALRALPTSNGKVGVIGYCSGGRQSFLTAISLPVDAAVDCYGAFVSGSPPEGFPVKVTPLIDRTGSLGCPLLGLFGLDDQFPSPEQVDELEKALSTEGKTYEFHRYEGAGHAFFSTGRTSFRPEAALDGWQRIFAWFETYLTPSEA